MNNLLITIEGVDGVGKSTITRILAECMGATAIQTPSEIFLQKRKLVEKSNNRKDKFDFYINAIIEQQEEIKQLLSASSVICDRYTHSTFAYQWSIDKDIPISINAYFENIRKPDYSFLLIVDKEKRSQRIKIREIETGIINEADHRLDIIDIAEKRYLNMSDLIQIDTTNKNADEICELILKKIMV